MSLTTLTVTVYMIVQGLAPSFWGSFSDVIGRRAIFMGTFAVYIIANIALGVSNNYGELVWLSGLYKLLVVRQQSQLVIPFPPAFDISWLINVGAGVIGDITTSPCSKR